MQPKCDVRILVIVIVICRQLFNGGVVQSLVCISACLFILEP